MQSNAWPCACRAIAVLEGRDDTILEVLLAPLQRMTELQVMYSMSMGDD